MINERKQGYHVLAKRGKWKDQTHGATSFIPPFPQFSGTYHGQRIYVERLSIFLKYPDIRNEGRGARLVVSFPEQLLTVFDFTCNKTCVNILFNPQVFWGHTIADMASILFKTTRFINDAGTFLPPLPLSSHLACPHVTILILLTNLFFPSAGLEKTLRLLQALVQIIAAYSLTATAAKPWLQARKQFALG